MLKDTPEKIKMSKLGHRVGRWVVSRWMEARIAEGRSGIGE
jgi:hypothetical protein